MSESSRATKKRDPKATSFIKLLCIDSSMNEAEKHVASLRNAGYSIQSRVIADPVDLKLELSEEPADLVLANCSHIGLDCTLMLQTLKESAPRTPLLLIHPDRQSNAMRDAMRMGARDVIPPGDMEMLQFVFRREIEAFGFSQRADRLQQQLNEVSNRCNTLIDSSRDAIAYVHEGMHILANQNYLSLFGLMDMDELEGVSLLDLVPEKDHQVFKRFLRDISDNVRSGSIEIALRTVDRNIFDASIDFSPASIDGEACTQLLIKDLSREKELQNRVRLLTNHDVETGLANRQYFIDKLNEIVPKLQQGGRGSLFYISIDNIQPIRAQIGNSNTDHLLSEVADLLTPLARDEGLVARFGDHTFTLFMEIADKGAVARLASEICALIHDHKYAFSPTAKETPTCSVGVAYGNTKTNSIQDFIDQAFHACEAAHKEGGNQWRAYEKPALKFKPLQAGQAAELGAITAAREEEAQMVRALDKALEHNRFRLFYQPIVSLQGDTRENYAVLVRLLNDEDDTLLPEKFLDYARGHGRMAAIDRWVIKHAMEELAMQRKNGRKISFFISISGDGLEDDTLLLWICDCLRQFDAKGPWITFQISDQDIRTHVQQTRALVDGLKKIRCNLAIDHFGVAPKYQSLLKHLPVDFIKLHPLFMDNLDGDKQKQNTIRDITEQAKEHDVRTIATGVEDANSLAILWTVGINYIQGYFLQEPSDIIGYDFNL